MSKPKMIYHLPLPMEGQVVSGSYIRPVKMLQAFESLGFEVFLIAGYVKERKKRIKEVKNRIIAGESYSFVYAESSTQPTSLTERHHLPVAPNLDYNFFKFCKQHSLKIGLFYRDIYWRFPIYKQTVNFFKSNTAIFFYRYELRQYRKFIDVLFLPSKEMAKYIPYAEDFNMDDLPPGHEVEEVYNYELNKKLRLIYVGGLNDAYKCDKLLESDCKNAEITISTRKEEWEQVKDKFTLADNIKVLFLKGKELSEKYILNNIALLFVEPDEYRKFAMPVKLFEYIGYGLPIIATKGTLVGEFIEKEQIGWVIPYDSDEFNELIDYLSQNQKEVLAKRDNILSIRRFHSWESRAQKVINILG